MPLRSYQQDLVAGIGDAFRAGAKGVMAQLPTGAGKTYTALSWAKAASDRSGHRTLTIVHRDELLHQWHAEAKGLQIPAGLLAATVGKKCTDQTAPLQIAMVDTLNRRPNAYEDEDFDWVFFDEAHLGSAAKFDKIRERFSDARFIGWSATPDRLDRKGFPWCDKLVRGPGYHVLEQLGALVPFTIYSIKGIDYTGLRKKFGEYTAESQSKQFMTQPLIGSVVGEYIDKAFMRTGLVFAVNVQHSKKLCAEFRAAGIPAAHIDGTTPREERRAVLDKLAQGDLWIVCNVGVLVEGLNITSISYIGIAFATASLPKWIQCSGRAVRPSDGKTDAIICDHGGNALRHGSLDYSFEWQLGPKPKRKRNEPETIRARICATCQAVYPLTEMACPVCGTIHVIQPKAPATKGGKLEKLSRGSGPVRRRKRGPTVKQLEDDVTSWVGRFR